MARMSLRKLLTLIADNRGDIEVPLVNIQLLQQDILDIVYEGWANRVVPLQSRNCAVALGFNESGLLANISLGVPELPSQFVHMPDHYPGVDIDKDEIIRLIEQEKSDESNDDIKVLSIDLSDDLLATERDDLNLDEWRDIHFDGPVGGAMLWFRNGWVVSLVL